LRKLLTITGILGGLGLLGFGMYQFFNEQINKAMNYCYKIKRYKFRQVTKDNIGMDIDVLIRNRSSFDLDVYGYNFNIFVNDRKVANVVNNTKQTINNNALSQVTVSVDFKPKDLFPTLNQALTLVYYATVEKSKFIIKVQGSVSAGSSFIKLKDLPVEITMNLQEITTDDPNKEVCSVVA
jgi:LEA14-like dessication related protein